jgi:hypothetical protein
MGWESPLGTAATTGGTTLPRNVSKLLQGYAESHPTEQFTSAYFFLSSNKSLIIFSLYKFSTAQWRFDELIMAYY